MSHRLPSAHLNTFVKASHLFSAYSSTFASHRETIIDPRHIYASIPRLHTPCHPHPQHRSPRHFLLTFECRALCSSLIVEGQLFHWLRSTSDERWSQLQFSESYQSHWTTIMDSIGSLSWTANTRRVRSESMTDASISTLSSPGLETAKRISSFQKCCHSSREQM